MRNALVTIIILIGLFVGLSLFSKDNKTQAQDVSGLLVNHHLLAGFLIEEAFAKAQTEKEITVLLIAPDHFAAGLAPITIGDEDWQTEYGILPVDKDLVLKLSEHKDINIEDKPFLSEHGIFNIIPYIKKYLPNAKVVPIIFNDSYSLEKIRPLSVYIDKALPVETLVVGSFDFTHEATVQIAYENDQKSLDIIQSSDRSPEAYQIVEIDSKPGLLLLTNLMDIKKSKFELLKQLNSAIILNDLTRQDVTSYITGYFYGN